MCRDPIQHDPDELADSLVGLTHLAGVLGADETLTLCGVSHLQISYQTHEGRQLSRDAQGGGIFFLARFEAEATPGVAYINWATGTASIFSLLRSSDS